ncbi:hypothetical protein Tcan_06650 [Toxocara canis]|uniref:Uncharacterized protein n=1 Tax=Toxocara canis TaxID=6265 RepID=A0A0B2VV46_TOXCA|nr:hypothetical protein Tcan_06650 [Toxocara canis]
MHPNVRGTCAMFHHSLFLIILLLSNGGFLFPSLQLLIFAQPYSVHKSSSERNRDTLTQSEFYSKIRALSRVSPTRTSKSSHSRYDSQSKQLYYSAQTRNPYSVNVDVNFEEPQDFAQVLSPYRPSNPPSWLPSKNREIRRHPLATSKPTFVPYAQPNGAPYLQRASKLFDPQRRPGRSDQQSRYSNQVVAPPAHLPPQNYIPPEPFRLPGTCDGGDCLKNNDAVSLYSPPNRGTAKRPPLLLISNAATTGEKGPRQYISQAAQSVSASLQRSGSSSYQEMATLSSSQIASVPSISDENGASVPQSVPDAGNHVPSSNYGNSRFSAAVLQHSEQQPFSGGAQLGDYIPLNEAKEQPYIARDQRVPQSNRYGAGASPLAAVASKDATTQEPHRSEQSPYTGAPVNPKPALYNGNSGTESLDEADFSPSRPGTFDLPSRQQTARYIGGGRNSYGSRPLPPQRFNYEHSPHILQANPAFGVASPSPSPPPNYGREESDVSQPRYGGGAQLSDYTPVAAPTHSTHSPATSTTENRNIPNDGQVYSIPPGQQKSDVSPPRYGGGAQLSDYTPLATPTPSTHSPATSTTENRNIPNDGQVYSNPAGQQNSAVWPPRYGGGAKLSDYTPVAAPTHSTRSPATSTAENRNIPHDEGQIYSIPPLLSEHKVSFL